MSNGVRMRVTCWPTPCASSKETNNPNQDTLVNLLVREDGDTIRAFLATRTPKGTSAAFARRCHPVRVNKYIRPCALRDQNAFYPQMGDESDAGNLT